MDTQATFVEELAARVRSAAKRLNLAPSALAKALEVPSSSFANYWKGDRAWPTEQLPGLSRELRMELSELLTGQRQPAVVHVPFSQREPASRSPQLEVTSEEMVDALDLVGVREIDLAYGLGETYADGEIEVTVRLFPRSWLRQITDTPPELLAFARGRGSSMQPTIQDGDMILIDRSLRSVFEQDELWALTVGQIAMIKRLRIRGERVTVLSDNDRVPPDDYHHEEINIVGRVTFVGRRV